MSHHQPDKFLICYMIVSIHICLFHHLFNVIFASALSHRFQKQTQIFGRYISISINIHHLKRLLKLFYSLLCHQFAKLYYRYCIRYFQNCQQVITSRPSISILFASYKAMSQLMLNPRDLMRVPKSQVNGLLR